jgi:DNA-binding HxlR family transcriptional regulator
VLRIYKHACGLPLRFSKRKRDIVIVMPNRTPKPGSPVRGSTSGVPLMALLDLLGRSWALGVVWALRGEPLTFRELQEACGGISSSVLRDRLRELREAGAIDVTQPGGYRLTPEGRRLHEIYKPLSAWAERWAERV